MENLALACPGCNAYKYAKIEALDPVDNATASLFHPRLQHWQDHFRWSEDFTLIVGITSTGRATVVALRLNRSELMNMRRILYLTGLHPPQEEEKR